MEKIRNILALTDLSDFSQEGIRYSLTLAKSLGAEVTVYHVVDCNRVSLDGGADVKATDMASPQYDRLKKRSQLALARFLNEHFSDLIPWVKIWERVEIGLPEKNIVEWMRRARPDLIVMSIHAGGDLSEGFIGSLAEKIIAAASCPVLSIHPDSTQTCNRAAAVA